MRLYDRYTTQNVMEVDLGTCEQGDPCSRDHTCRIHKVYGFLKAARMLAERSSVDDTLDLIYIWARVPGAIWSTVSSSKLPNRFRVEVEGGQLWIVHNDRPCLWCLQGNPRIRSSVTEHLIHTDTPVGREVCTDGIRTLVGGDAGTSWYLTADPQYYPGPMDELPFAGVSTTIPPGFPRECEFGRVD